MVVEKRRIWIRIFRKSIEGMPKVVERSRKTKRKEEISQSQTQVR
jgi:hypothetical protein